MSLLKAFYHQATFSWSYVIADSVGGRAMIVDPVLDYEPAAARVSYESAQQLLEYVQQQQLKVKWIVETHAHADHLSAAAWLHEHLHAPIGIGEGIVKVQRTFGQLLNTDVATDGRPFDRLFVSHDEFRLGQLRVRAIHTPGHTNDSVTYLVDDVAFIGDTLFAPDYGTARCDFPGGNAGRLYDSIQQLYALPDSTRLLLCHDYPPPTREPRYQTTVAEQRANNIHLDATTGREAFVQMRTTRDATLATPKLLWPAVQVNIQAGRLPAAGDNGITYLKIPLDQLGKS